MKWAFITGATSDLGTALGSALAARGYSLLLTAPKEAALKKLQENLQTKTLIFPADLNQEKERKALLSWAIPYCPDLVINNAGAGLYGPALMHSAQENLNILSLNASALLEITLETARFLRLKSKRGTILNISSVAAYFSYPSFSVYSASKSFVNSFSRAFDTEMKPYGIRILCASPGQIDTKFRLKASKNRFNEKTFMTLSVDKAAQALLKQVEKQKPAQIIDLRYLLLVLFLKLLPLSLRHRLLSRSISRRFSSDRRFSSGGQQPGS